MAHDLHGAEEDELEKELSEFFKAGTIICVRAHESKPGKGLSYPALRGRLLEDARTGGWDVYEIEVDGRMGVTYGYSVYGFSIERCEQGFRMDDDLEGLSEPPRNRKVHNLFQQPDGRWVFRYGPTSYRFENEEKFFNSREDAVRVAMKNGWMVQDNGMLRKPHSGGINGVR